MTPHGTSVFLDVTGKRWRAIRRVTLIGGIATTLVALGLAVTFIMPETLPNLREANRAVRVHRGNPLAVTRLAARKAAAKLRLMAALARRPAPPSARVSELEVVKNRKSESRPAASRAAGNAVRPGIVAGFVVKWDDNSFASFKAHATAMDWVVGEWASLSAGGSSIAIGPDAKVLYFVQTLPENQRPRVFAMLSNVNSNGRGDIPDLRRLLATPASRQAAALQLTHAAERYGLAGITLDFEDVPDDLLDHMFAFMGVLHAALAPGGRLLTSAVAVSTDEATARRYAEVNDYLFLMLYDEHYGTGDPGPVASQVWYVAQARQLMRAIPPQKAILALGAYGYDWNDAGGKLSPGHALTFEDVMLAARNNSALVQLDSVSLNPYLSWSDADSVDHVVWFLDGVTAWNQARAATTLNAAGAAIWRLGSEDPSLWSVISNDVDHPDATMLEAMPPGYDPMFDGNGEMLRLSTRPSTGRRFLQEDPRTGMIVHERITQFPAPWIVQRFGGRDSMKVALTFDDGPDPRYTNAILDTLKSRGVKATFFMIGRQADENPGIARRVVREGHEVGNHTYTHPNLALTSAWIARLEIVATGRLLETVIDRRTALFRAPYFGDAEPTTSDELDPIGIATDLGYLSVGVHIDSEDWQLTNPDSILRRTMDARQDNRVANHVVLFHDSGGDRRASVAVLGRIIDSLRAEGDSLVLVSELAGISRDEAMPVLKSRATPWRIVDVLAFGLLGVTDWGLYWIFLVAVILGVARLVFIITLAAIQRRRSRAPPPDTGTFAPPVTVVVPAYREERVIVRTVASLLAQDYRGPLDIVVVDDGSPDQTFAEAERAFGDEPRVRLYRKPNGGKASALNYGIAHTSAEIVVCLDADTQFEPETVRHLVAPLANPRVGAVAGNAKVGNRVNLVTRWQALEYVTSQNLDRRAFSLLDCITVVPGAVGAWRRSCMVEAGEFTGDTLAEDQDLTIRIRRRGHSIAYAERAIAWTEAPDELGALSAQRFRWSFGTLQCAWKHRDLLLRRGSGALGWVALPNTWLFQLLLTALSPLADLMFVWALFNVWLTWRTHGESYSLTDLLHVMMFFAVFILTDWLGAMIAFMMEPDEERGLAWLVMLQRFAYRQIMYSVVVRSVIAAIRGRVVGWGQLERKATVELPA